MSVQLHTYVEKRLLAWKLYTIWLEDRLTRDPTPAAVKSWWLTIVMRPKLQQMKRTPEVQRSDCPVDEVECGITQLCIGQLPDHLRNAVLLCWLSRGTMEEKARELGISRRQYFRWIDSAYAELLGLFNDHEAGVERIDLDQVNAELEAARANVPASGPVSGRIKRPALHGIARAVRADQAMPKKAAGTA